MEFISTLRNFRPAQDLILIKTSHPRLEVAKVVGGMSGSPIYLNGKMIGAYAYGWLFGAEAVAGVTPIQSMLADQNRPIPPSLAPRGGSPLALGAVPGGARELRSGRGFVGALAGYDLAEHGKQLVARTATTLAAPEVTGLERVTTPLMVGGASAVGMRIAHELLTPLGLEPLQAGGSGASTPGRRFRRASSTAARSAWSS